MHKGKGVGRYYAVVEEKYKKHGIKVITNGCPLMFVGKVDIFHKFVKWLKK